ncbi:MAG: galactose mutarotase [Bacteroidales bacterium]|nr:galactose mutarotase [Bacteroidales bacterium]
MKIESFGVMPDGKEVEKFTIRNRNGMSLSAINYGGIITSLYVPDKNGKFGDVVLGYDTLEEYMADDMYMGSVIGRCADRVAGATFLLDGRQYTLFKNAGENSNHGGRRGFGKKWWHIQEKQTRDGIALRLSYTSLDGEEGYPGKLSVEILYVLTDDNCLVFRYTAMSTKKTLINLTNHTYFNLSAKGNTNVLEHKLQVKTNYFLAANDQCVPTGEFFQVENTPLDFREQKNIQEGMDTTNEQVTFAGGLDHCYVVPSAKEPVLHYEDTESGRVLEIKTLEPGIRVCVANNCNVTGKKGAKYENAAGIAFLAEHFPDSIHHTNFPTVVLPPKHQYSSETRLKFMVKG